MPTQGELEALEQFRMELDDSTLGKARFVRILKTRYRQFALDMHPDKSRNNLRATSAYQVMQSHYCMLLELAETLMSEGIPSQASQPGPSGENDRTVFV